MEFNSFQTEKILLIKRESNLSSQREYCFMKVASLVARAILSFLGFGQAFFFGLACFQIVGLILDREGELGCGVGQTQY